MKFVFPIADKTADEHYKMNRCGFGGFFPIGAFNTWHGGMHFDGNNKVVAIADGVIIAYRFTKTYISENVKSNNYRYSNCFMLIQHEYVSPKGALLKFYSLYMHLCPWNELTGVQRKSIPSFFTKNVVKVQNAKGLNVRSSMDASTQANYLRTLKNDTIVEYTVVNENWARLTGDAEEYIHYNGKVANATVPVDPELDKLVLCTIPVNANDVLGYSGLYEDPETPKNYTTVHIELFSSNAIEPFILNHLKDGKHKPIQFCTPAGTSLKAKQKKYVQEKIKYNGKIAKNTTVKILDAPGTDYYKLQEYELIRVIPKEYVSGYDKNSKRYKVLTAETLPELSKLFDMYPFTKTDSLKFIGYANNSGQMVDNDAKNPPLKRIVSFRVPSEYAETYWAKKCVINKIEKGLFTAENEITDLYNANPDTLSFEKEICKTAEELLVTIEGCETCNDENGILWYKIKGDTGSGWICDTDSTIKKVSAADWPGFAIVKEDCGDTQFDPLIDADNLSPFFKTIINKINKDHGFFSFLTSEPSDSKKINKAIVTKKEMLKALNDQKMSEKLRRLICYSPSEWWTDSSFSQYERIFKLAGDTAAERLKQRLKNLCWWDDVATKTEGFPLSPSVYHWNPVAFIENMIKMSDILLDLLEKDRLDVDEIILARKLIAGRSESERADLFIKLQSKVKYRNQRNNNQTRYTAERMCNLTSIAMSLEFLGIENPEPQMQFEDYLEKLRQEKEYGARTLAGTWDDIVSNFDVKMKHIELYTNDKTIITNKLKNELMNGHGVIISIFSEASGKGHIVRLQNILNDGLIVDDPYGKLNDFKERENKGFGYTGTKNPVDSESGIGEDNLWLWENINETMIKFAEIFTRKE
jgi:hypothetical protein